MDNNNSNKPASDTWQKAVILSVAIVAILFIVAFTLFKNSPDVNIYSVTIEKTVYDFIPDSEKININTASKEELMELNGIGDVISDRIINYRETNGDFESIEDLLEIKGITRSTLENISPYIKTNDP